MNTVPPIRLQECPTPGDETPPNFAPNLPASLTTIGRLISGFGDQSTGQDVSPVIDPREMARRLKVTFRPLPPNVSPEIRGFTEQLERELTRNGVTVLSWQQATAPSFYEVALPLTQRIFKVPALMTHGDIDAVFDVETTPGLVKRLIRSLMEGAYLLHRRFGGLHKRHRAREILRLVWWAEERAVKYISNHVRTQVVSIHPLDRRFADPATPYAQKLTPGLRKLVESLAPILLGVSTDQISLLNMNLSDTVCPRTDLARFVLESLIPKLHAQIRPLTRGRFQVSSFDPLANRYAERVIDLAGRISPLGLLPEAVALSQLIRRASTRDVVGSFADGRSGVSFGFVGYLEPPVYVGPRELTAEEWERLEPPRELPAGEVRRTAEGRLYLRTWVRGEQVYRQVPDVWIVSSRSGAEKNKLQRDRDLIRLGYDGTLRMELPAGQDWAHTDIRPSYDTYVMLALAVGAAIYHPELVRDGAPLVHFHGYPSADWFREGEGYAGEKHPSVACGTFEAGVLNYLGLWRLAERGEVQVACLIEPDHGCNFLAGSVDALVARLEEGVQSGRIVLGGKHLPSLRGRMRTVAEVPVGE